MKLLWSGTCVTFSVYSPRNIVFICRVMPSKCSRRPRRSTSAPHTRGLFLTCALVSRSGAKGLTARRSPACREITQPEPLFWCLGPAARTASSPTCLNQLERRRRHLSSAGAEVCKQEERSAAAEEPAAGRTGTRAEGFAPRTRDMSSFSLVDPDDPAAPRRSDTARTENRPCFHCWLCVPGQCHHGRSCPTFQKVLKSC